MDAVRYPIGAFAPQAEYGEPQRRETIAEIAGLAGRIRESIAGISPAMLEKPYREGGWTIRQIVHHLADNDLNAYFRFKRALTEDEPTASSYREDAWAELPDYGLLALEDSVLLMEVLHRRFVVLLNALEPAAFGRTLRTGVMGAVTLDVALQRFAWHHRHHRAQILGFLDRIRAE